MAGIAQNPRHDFWQPPAGEAVAVAIPISPVHPAPDEICSGCGTEFMVGAGYCHSCGLHRHDAPALPKANGSDLPWVQAFRLLRLRLGLSRPSLIAFLAGVTCLAVAIIGGAFYSSQAYPDFPAIMLWRMQWLVASVAAFLAGILLKRPESQQK